MRVCAMIYAYLLQVREFRFQRIDLSCELYTHHTCTHAHIHTYIHIHSCTHIFTNMHTHTVITLSLPRSLAQCGVVAASASLRRARAAAVYISLAAHSYHVWMIVAATRAAV